MTDAFRVVALLAARNENDIIGQVIEDLVSQGIEVYFIDDGSTDGTLETVRSWTDRGVIGIGAAAKQSRLRLDPHPSPKRRARGATGRGLVHSSRCG